MNGLFFLSAVVLISLMLFGLIVATLCYTWAVARAGTTAPAYITSATTWWTYMALAIAIGVIMLLVLLYLAYAWSCACAKPVCAPVVVRKPRCAPSSCY